MLEKIKITAKNKEQALELASKQLKKNKETIVVKETFSGKKNIFGMFKELPQFEAYLKEEENNKITNNLETKVETEKVIEFIELHVFEIFKFFGVENVKKNVFLADDVYNIEVFGEELKFLVENNGKLLNALQYIIVLIVNNFFNSSFRVVLDYENFREKRVNFLKELACKISKKVLETEKAVTLEPMNPFERRLIHSFTTEIEGVFSKSIGKEPKRSVVIYPESIYKK